MGNKVLDDMLMHIYVYRNVNFVHMVFHKTNNFHHNIYDCMDAFHNLSFVYIWFHTRILFDMVALSYVDRIYTVWLQPPNTEI